MGQAKIGVILKDGKIAVKTMFKEVSKGDLSLLITHIDLLKQELLSNFKKGVKKI